VDLRQHRDFPVLLASGADGDLDVLSQRDESKELSLLFPEWERPHGIPSFLLSRVPRSSFAWAGVLMFIRHRLIGSGEVT